MTVLYCRVIDSSCALHARCFWRRNESSFVTGNVPTGPWTRGLCGQSIFSGIGYR